MGQTLSMVMPAQFTTVTVPLSGVKLVFASISVGADAEDSRIALREIGRDCAKWAAWQLVGGTLGELTYSELGAPLIDGEPHISISRTGNYAIGAAAMQSIGVDLEFRDRDVTRLVRVFSETEKAIAETTGSMSILCAKEAAGKAAGVGLAGSVTRWEVSQSRAQDQVLVIRDKHTDQQWSVWTGVLDIGQRPLQYAIALPIEQTCDVLMGIYESAHVEMRPVGSKIWQDAVATVRARDSSGVVITAWNPGSDRPSLAENKQANELLLKRLQHYCNDIWEADGFSPDRVHREPGFIAWGMPAQVGQRIAREFGQLAIFYFEPDGTRLLLST